MRPSPKLGQPKNKTPTMSKKYTIEVTEEQLRLLSMSCEFTSRFISGQVDTSVWPSAALHNDVMNHKDPDWSERRTEANKLMDQLKMLIWKMPSNSHYGVGFHDDGNGLWDMYQVFRHVLWKELSDEDRELTRHTVMSSPALQFGKLSLAKACTSREAKLRALAEIKPIFWKKLSKHFDDEALRLLWKWMEDEIIGKQIDAEGT